MKTLLIVAIVWVVAVAVTYALVKRRNTRVVLEETDLLPKQAKEEELGFIEALMFILCAGGETVTALVVAFALH